MKNRKLLTEEISKDIWGKWTIDGLYDWFYYFDGKESNSKEIDKLLESVGLNIDSSDLAKMLGEFKGSKLSNVKPLLIGTNSEGEEIYFVPCIEFSEIEEYHKKYKEVSLKVHCDLSTSSTGDGEIYLFGIVGLFKVGNILPFLDFALNESKKKNKTMKKSLKEYRTVGLEQEVRDKCIEILEDSHSYLFDLGMSDAIITYDNKGRAKTTSSGDVWIDYITLPLDSWSSGRFPSNKKAEKLFNQIIDYNLEYARERLWDEHEDELIELGITDKDDDKLNYNDLYDMDRGDLAEELSEYELDMEGTELYTNVGCDITEVDDGIELEVSMLIEDEYGHALVKDYKSKSVIITEDTKDIEDTIFDCIRSVTENW